MVRRWDGFRDAWDREYAMRGPLWRGRADVSPLTDRLDGGARVLELGCGDGKFLRALAAGGWVGVGLDRSRRGLALCRDASARLLNADARRVPVRSGAMTAVAARYVLGALAAPDRAVAAAEAWRVVAPGGWLLVEEFSTRDFRAGQGRLVEPGTRERNRGIWTHYWTPKEVVALLPEAPQEVAEVAWEQRTDRGPMPRRAWRALWRRPVQKSSRAVDR